MFVRLSNASDVKSDTQKKSGRAVFIRADRIIGIMECSDDGTSERPLTVIYVDEGDTYCGEFHVLESALVVAKRVEAALDHERWKSSKKG